MTPATAIVRALRNDDATPPLEPEKLLRAEAVASLLGIGRATFYRIRFFRARRIRAGARRVGYRPSDVALYQSLQEGK